MTLKSLIDAELKASGKTFKWLVGEVGISNDGLKAGLENETIKLKDLKKLAKVLNMPIHMLFAGDTTIQSQIGGTYNTQATHSTLHEPATEYVKKDVEMLQKHIALLESQIIDKDKIIDLLSR